MYGGTLCSTSLLLNEDQNLLVSAYSNTLCVFNVLNDSLLHKFTLTPSPILCFHCLSSNKSALIQSNGNISYFTLFQPTPSLTLPLHNSPLISALITPTHIAFITLSHQFYLLQSTISPPKFKIIYHSQQFHTSILQLTSHCCTISLPSGVTVYTLTPTPTSHFLPHPTTVHCATTQGNKLHLGDANGKILVYQDFKNAKVKQLYEWHTHSVNTLFYLNGIMYSAGAEGVVVVWNLQQHTRSFIPRVGGCIDALRMINGRMYCLMRDNYITMIDFNEDKTVHQYAIIKRPSCQPLLQEIDQGVIALTSLPLRIQLIDNNRLIEVAVENNNHIVGIEERQNHQIRSFAGNKDWIIAFVQGVLTHTLIFYSRGRQMVTQRIENSHKGRITVQNHQDGFITFGKEDCSVRLWGKKEKEEMWSCRRSINFRNKLPLDVCGSKQTVVVSYLNEVVIYSGKGEQVVRNKKQIFAVRLMNESEFGVFYKDSSVDVLNIQNQCITTQVVAKSRNTFLQMEVVQNKNELTKIALWLQYEKYSTVTIIDFSCFQKSEILTIQNSKMLGVNWIQNKLMLLDSHLLLHCINQIKQIKDTQNHCAIQEQDIQNLEINIKQNSKKTKKTKRIKHN